MTTVLPSTNYSLPIPHAPAVQFFRHIPRWPSASTRFQFSFDYLTPVALTSLLPIIFGFILTSLFLLHLIVRYTCRESAVNSRIKRYSVSRPATLLQSVFSSLILFVIFTFVSLTLLANASLNFTAHDALDVIAALIDDLSLTGFSVVDVALFFRNNISALVPSNQTLQLLASNNYLPDSAERTVSVMRQFILRNYPQLQPLRTNLLSLSSAITKILNVLRKIVGLLNAVLLAVIFLLASAPVLLFIVDAFALSKRRRLIRVLAHLMYILLPSLFCWVCVGVTASVGSTISDVCVMLHDYRAVLHATSNQTNNNALLQSGFDCPKQSNINVRDMMRQSAQSVLDSRLATTTVNVLFATSAESIADTALWSGDRVELALNCTLQQEFSGKLESVVCSPAGHSAIQGVYAMFVGFLGLAVCLNIAGACSLFGVQVARSLILWRRAANVKETSLFSGNIVDGTESGSGSEVSDRGAA